MLAATSLFEERGYAATPIVAIAEAADVAEQTVYAAFGNKRTLLAQAVDQAIAGDDEQSSSTTVTGCGRSGTRPTRPAGCVPTAKRWPTSPERASRPGTPISGRPD
ncbi:MAG: TetR/AcrR family transcriptional regulator [Acidimicrobiales bacterium]